MQHIMTKESNPAPQGERFGSGRIVVSRSCQKSVTPCPEPVPHCDAGCLERSLALARQAGGKPLEWPLLFLRWVVITPCHIDPKGPGSQTVISHQVPGSTEADKTFEWKWGCET